MTDVAEDITAVPPALGQIEAVIERASIRPEEAALGVLDGTKPTRARPQTLLALLVVLDVVTAWVTWMVVLEVSIRSAPIGETVTIAIAAALVTSLLAWNQRLYQERFCVVRSQEFARIVRIALVSGIAALSVGKLFGGIVTPVAAEIGAVALIVSLAGARSVFTGWLRLARSNGGFATPVCVIGSDDEAEDLVHLLGDHPELGYRVTAVVGDPTEWRDRVPGVRFLAAGHDPAAAVRATGATGVVVAASALASAGRDRLIASLIRQGLHVQISAGLSRVGHQRLRVAPLAHQLAFYIEPRQLSGSQAAVKRTLDLFLASTVVLLSAPLIALAALMIKIQDRGPVFYRQVRVGRDGRTFQLMKLRTMVPDAAARAAEIAALNERQGPLFKVTNDPRVTRVGRFLRMSSIDELPQLINVIRGEMSLVGPRPALPSEVAQFDADLLERSRVMPGITGLWQVEARDNPSFRAYKRLDLFYVDNWSVRLDLYIMGATARMLIARVASALLGGGERVAKREAAGLTNLQARASDATVLE
jgi:exopolysaccharide biosynthesis polyprenyl glycosylphosphotransferase